MGIMEAVEKEIQETLRTGRKIRKNGDFLDLKHRTRSIYVIGLILRKSKTFLKMGFDSIAVLFIYIITLYVLYSLRDT